MAMDWLGSAIAGSASHVNLGISTLATRKQNILNRAFQKSERLASQEYQTAEREAQNQWDLEMWNRQNEYDTPANQMQRMMDAGINPNNAANGNVSAASPGTANTANNGSAPGGPVMPQFDEGAAFRDAAAMDANFGVQMAQIQDYMASVEEKKAHVAQLRSQTDLTTQQALYQQIENFIHALWSPQERSMNLKKVASSIGLDIQQTHVLRQTEKKEAQLAKEAGFNAESARIAKEFAEQENAWILTVKNPQEIDNMKAVYQQAMSAAEASHESANLLRKEQVTEGTRNELMEKQVEGQEEENTALKIKNQIDGLRAFMVQHNVDPDAPESRRRLQFAEQQLKNGNSIQKVLGFMLGVWNYGVENFAGAVGPAIGGAVGGMIGTRGALKNVPQSVQNPEPGYKFNTGYQGSYSGSSFTPGN